MRFSCKGFALNMILDGGSVSRLLLIGTWSPGFTTSTIKRKLPTIALRSQRGNSVTHSPTQGSRYDSTLDTRVSNARRRCCNYNRTPSSKTAVGHHRSLRWVTIIETAEIALAEARVGVSSLYSARSGSGLLRWMVNVVQRWCVDCLLLVVFCVTLPVAAFVCSEAEQLARVAAGWLPTNLRVVR